MTPHLPPTGFASRRRALAMASLALAVSLTAGCSDDSAPDGGAKDGPVTIEITVADGSVTPQGDRVDIATGQDVVLKIDADTGGELHVHSEPEQAVEFEAGESEHTITIDTPGLIDIELHEPEALVVQLEVR